MIKIRVHGRGGQDLDRHQAPHPPVLRLVHLAHAPGADLLQDHVLAEDQAPRLPLVECRCLVSGEPLRLDELPRKALNVLRASLGGQALLKRRELFRREKAASGQILDELFQGDRHRPS